VTTPVATPHVDLVVYLTFDSFSADGSTALDASVNHINASLFGVSRVPGAIGQGLGFSGQASYANAGYSPTVAQSNSNLSISAWIKTTNNSRSESIVSRYDSAGREAGYLLKTTPQGVLDMRLGGSNVGGNVRDVLDTTRINDGQWHLVTVAMTLGQGVQFYIDGKLSTSQTIAYVSNISGAPLYIGSMPYPSYATNFTGSIDEVRIYDRAITASEVAALYAARIIPASTPIATSTTTVATSTTPLPTSTSPLVISSGTTLRINAGGTLWTGSTYTDPSGNQWVPDIYYSGGTTAYGNTPGSNWVIDSTGRMGYDGPFSYHIPVANGNYSVTLEFVEYYVASPGQRSFNVNIEGNNALSNFDILSQTKPFTPLYKTFTTTVTNGYLDLSFAGVIGQPTVSSISIVPALATQSASISDLRTRLANIEIEFQALLRRLTL
jgi:hypothetical protein